MGRAQYSRVEKFRVRWKVCTCRKLVLLILWNIWLESFSCSCTISMFHENMAR